METFVLIFRQGPNQLSDEEKTRRAKEIVGWANAHNDMGYKLESRILAPGIAYRAPNEAPAGDWPVTALVFFEARDFADATHVADAHPAIHYGTSIEVCTWTSPGARPAILNTNTLAQGA